MPLDRRLPAIFDAPATLRVLNALAVPTSLAAATTAALRFVFRPTDDRGLAISVAAPTFVLGVLWMVALRSRKTFAGTTIRAGWVASLPLAAANAAISCGILVAFGAASAEKFAMGAFFGATVGAIIWVPALVLTLLCFGVPIARAQRLAERGLAGEERGEKVVGIVSAAIAVASTVSLIFGRGWDDLTAANMTGEASALCVVGLCSALAVAAGVLAAVLADRREVARRDFVLRVERGEVEGYRVDPSDEGKVLVRITSMGEGYRVASLAEPVFGIDAAGEATRSLQIERGA